MCACMCACACACMSVCVCTYAHKCGDRGVCIVRFGAVGYPVSSGAGILRGSYQVPFGYPSFYKALQHFIPVVCNSSFKDTHDRDDCSFATIENAPT